MQDRLLKYVIDRSSVDASQLRLETPLFSEGLLDSLVVLDLVALIEKESGITFAVSEINLDNLDSVERILAFIATKRSGS
jgi:acyl carrier protein